MRTGTSRSRDQLADQRELLGVLLAEDGHLRLDEVRAA